MSKLRLYHTYLNKFNHARQIWGDQIKDLNKKYKHGNWKNLRVHNSHYGQIGYSYEIIDKTIPVSPEKQFIRIIQEKSNGLNSLSKVVLCKMIIQ